MSELREVGAIQLNEDVSFARREWRAQRIGWIGMAVVVVLALLGVLGRGPLSSTERGSRSSLAVKYDKIIRHGSAISLDIYVAEGLQTDSTLKVFLSDEYLRKFTILDIVPEPRTSGTSGTLVYYIFTRPNSRQPAHIAFHMQPSGFWNSPGIVALQGATAIRFGQFILP